MGVSAPAVIGRAALNPADFGARPGTVSPEQIAYNTAAVSAAWQAGLVRGMPVEFSRLNLYQTGALTIPSGATTVGTCRLQPIVSTGNPAAIDVVANSGGRHESLLLEMPAQALSKNSESMIIYGDNQFTGPLGIAAADGVQRNGTIVLHGHQIKIATAASSYINRPFLCQAASVRDGVSPIAAWQGLEIHEYYIYMYIRGFRLQGLAEGYLGSGWIKGRPDGIVKTPGYNSILCGGLTNFTFKDAEWSDSAEHANRIGGAPGYDNTRITIGNITSHRSGGCVVKANDGSLDEFGNKRLNRALQVGNIFASDVGLASGQGHGSSVLRVSHCRNAQFGYVQAVPNTTAYGAWMGLEMVDCDGVAIDGLSVMGLCRRLINVRSDGDFASNVPDVRNVTIGYVSGRGDGVSPAAFRFNLKPMPGGTDPDTGETLPGTPQGTVGDFRILGGDIYGFANLAVVGEDTIGATDSTPIDGDVYFRTSMHGSVSAAFYGTPPASGRVRLDMILSDGTRTTRYEGRGDRYTARSNNMEVGPLDVTDANPSGFGPIARPGLDVTPGLGAVWPVLSSERASMGLRRAWTIAAEQDNANDWRVGLSAYRTTSSTSSALTRWWRFTSLGDLRLDMLGMGLVVTSPDGTQIKRISIDNSGNIITTTVT